ncbi:MAG: hypothetical protein U1E26_07530, partial [Coriobacteriia bacterium]|nr:hypothetical protein [Coriobacteriia bacterium]
MKPRATRSFIVIAAIALFAAALAFSAAPALFAADGESVIETAEPVEKTSCAPCHLDLGDVDVPGLVFGHGNHLLVSCDACHSRMPHRGDNNTEHVPMEVCFACHGISHGDQGELATSECEDCHTPSFQLRPKSHSADWAKTPHAEASASSGVNSCMMCHDAGPDCDACHAKEAPDVAKMPPVYHTVVTPLPKGPNVQI